MSQSPPCVLSPVQQTEDRREFQQEEMFFDNNYNGGEMEEKIN